MTIYTIGYARLGPPTRLRRIVRHLNAKLIDCRSSPRSRIKGYGGRQLAELLGDAYDYAGDQLGGRGPVTAEGLALLEPYHRARTRHCIAMCLEDMPADCHRFHAITEPHFPRARHIVCELLTLTNAQVRRMIDTGELPDDDDIGDIYNFPREHA